MRVRRVMTGLCVGGALTAAAVGVGLSRSAPRASAEGTAPANAVEATVEEAENAILASYSPMASSPSQNSACQAESCSLTNLDVGVATSAVLGFTDNQTQSAGALESGIVDGSNVASVTARYNPTTVSQRNQSVLGSVFSPSVGIGSETEQAARNWMGTDSSWLAGEATICRSRACTLVGAAGAEVTAFSNENISATHATVTATVVGWQDDAHFTGIAGSLTWQRVQSTLDVKETLTKQANGAWVITTRKSSFAPATAP